MHRLANGSGIPKRGFCGLNGSWLKVMSKNSSKHKLHPKAAAKANLHVHPTNLHVHPMTTLVIADLTMRTQDSVIPAPRGPRHRERSNSSKTTRRYQKL